MSVFGLLRSASKVRQFSTITVIGSGIMGSGIAQTIVQDPKNAYKVTVVDVNEGVLSKSKDGIEKSLNRVAKKQMSEKSKTEQEEYVSSTINKLKFSSDMLNSVKDADLIIEAVSENLSLKQKLFYEIDKELKGNDKSPILCTNTSSLSVTDISLLVTDKKKFAGLHFFNPVPVMPLVEVASTELTDPGVSTKLINFCKSINKTPVVCRDTPGFIVNRLLVPYMVQAVEMYERGDATKEMIDSAMKLGASYPMGPFQLADYVGLDTMKFIMDGWSERFPDEPGFKCPQLLNDLVKQGRLGVKSGAGFYNYKK